MTKRIVSDDVFKMAKDFKNYVETNQKVPFKLTYHNIEYNTPEMMFAFVYGLYHLKSNFDIPNIKWPQEAKGDQIKETIKKDDFKKQALNVYNAIQKTGQIPNYVTTIGSKKKVNIDLFAYCLAKILIFYKDGRYLPDTCEYNYRVLEVPTASLDTLANLAGKVKENVEKKYEIPSEINGFRHGEYTYLFAKIIANYGVTIERKGVGTPKNPTGDNIEMDIYKTHFVQLAKNLIKYVDENKQLPNYLTFNGYKIKANLYEYMFAKILDYYYYNRQLPNKVYVNNNAFVKPQPKKTYSEKIFDYFSSKFGKPTSIDDALEKIQGRGYGFYYDDHKTNKQTIDALATRGAEKPNCTDVHQMLWHIGKVLGYDVRAIHVWCITSNVGHVRLDFNRGNGWFSRDGAAVIDGECISCVWCSRGEHLATNPAWFTSNLNR